MSRWLSGLRVALRSMVRRRRVEDELNEEFQYHLERQIDEGLHSGLTPTEARNAALRAMGAVDKSKEECRDLRSANFVTDFLGDLRYAGRALRRSPGFAVLASVIMALGIGANTAVFSVVNAVLLKPLAYPGSDRIVTLRTTFLATGSSQALVAIANFRDWREQTVSFEAMATYRGGESAVSTSSAQAEYGRTASVDPQFFKVFAVEPILGRTFNPGDVADGGQPVLISYAYWQSRFGGEPTGTRSNHSSRQQYRGRLLACCHVDFSFRAKPMCGSRKRLDLRVAPDTTSLPSDGSSHMSLSNKHRPIYPRLRIAWHSSTQRATRNVVSLRCACRTNSSATYA